MGTIHPSIGWSTRPRINSNYHPFFMLFFAMVSQVFCAFCHQNIAGNSISSQDKYSTFYCKIQ